MCEAMCEAMYAKRFQMAAAVYKRVYDCLCLFMFATSAEDLFINRSVYKHVYKRLFISPSHKHHTLWLVRVRVGGWIPLNGGVSYDWITVNALFHTTPQGGRSTLATDTPLPPQWY